MHVVGLRNQPMMASSMVDGVENIAGAPQAALLHDPAPMSSQQIPLFLMNGFGMGSSTRGDHWVAESTSISE